MTDEEIKSNLENIADDFGIELTSRQTKKLSKLIAELSEENASREEIFEELKTVSPDDEDEDWNELIEAMVDFVVDNMDDFEEYQDDEI
jgi:hypothetical protein